MGALAGDGLRDQLREETDTRVLLDRVQRGCAHRIAHVGLDVAEGVVDRPVELQ